ncbi:HAD family hydrolase [Nonomuraea wenchangensis]|uniref:HAD family hydrolase n=1 Tax=Nonomuraea wenchangensis TaxID=568860 RepID=UPI0038508B52
MIVFVTARPPRGVREIAEQAGVTGTAICSNGAIVYDLDTGAFPRTCRSTARSSRCWRRRSPSSSCSPTRRRTPPTR